MKNEYRIKKLKTFAKRHARANRLALNQSQGMIAKELGFSHWNALKSASKSDWIPSDNELAKIEAFVGINFQAKKENGTEIDPDSVDNMEQDEEGRIGEHSFQIINFLGDAMVRGEGWTVRINSAEVMGSLATGDEDCGPPLWAV